MSYELKFLPSAWKEWNKLGSTIKKQFKHKLAERLRNPIVAGDRLRGFPHHYKIKLRQAGYRLVYEVDQESIAVVVITVGKRENDLVYRHLRQRRNRRADEG